MKVITFAEILSFFTIVGINIALSLASLLGVNHLMVREIGFNFANFSIFMLFLTFYSFVAYRILLWLKPIPSGPIPDQPKDNWVYHLHTLFYLLFFNPIIGSGICPLPFRRNLYRFLGAKVGFNTYPAGTILDPQFVEVGSYCVIGMHSLICPHIQTVGQISHEPIKIGDHVTISVRATIYGGVTIEDGAKVLPHAVVNPNTHIYAGEVWGGIPARKIRGADGSRALSG